MGHRAAAIRALVLFATYGSVLVAAVLARESGCGEHLASLVQVTKHDGGTAPTPLLWSEDVPYTPCVAKAKQLRDTMLMPTAEVGEMAMARQKVAAEYFKEFGMDRLANILSG
eukprot:NODE_16356_length_999_cov_3.538991.p1 GENE.NODE_16356_length_999_cov_3.538991~~NODE_16356_length_999_cov_3.538991.p1  ORF type:complete len:113 (-),score=41.74 NODE_16356_length_999_cov_3.538991:560-898(-)